MSAAADLERCIAGGGVALFPADTVYGLACDPESKAAVERIYEIKGRPPERPAAVMFFRLEDALAALPWLGERTRAAFERLLPGPFTLIVPNPEQRFPLACGPVPEKLGVRVPDVQQLRDVRLPVLQSSANPSGGRDARRLSDVDRRIRAQVDLELDGGELPGTPSTVIDLGQYESGGEPAVLREGAVPAAELAGLL
ncbi:MAG TPA: L-threonylcarbamoyladenylate synthase [Thermoleophilaceae bacterium]|nr:L-threonylcarbamoyladenylate synthase [Thermoleophilaceae bacterium]